MKYIIYTDGASRDNPGPAGVGIVFCDSKASVLKKHSEFLGKMTNNEAEYMGIVIALKKFKSLFGKKEAKNAELEIRSDSELLVKQLSGEYKILDEKLQKLFIQVWNLKLDFRKVLFKHILRGKNKEADALANEALDQQKKTKKLL